MTDDKRARLAQDLDKAGRAEALIKEFADLFEQYAGELMDDLRYADPDDIAGVQRTLNKLHVIDDVKQTLITRYNDGVAARAALEQLNEESDDGPGNDDDRTD